jgi:guanylate kinase
MSSPKIDLAQPDTTPYFGPPPPLLIVISGPSGVGKDETLKTLQQASSNFHFVVTATTRPMRPNEVHGRDYFFVSLEEFTRMIEEGELLEHALVYGDYKGIPKQQVREALASGKDVVMRIDVQGAATIRSLVHDAVFIFLCADNEAELVERLRARKTEAEEKLRLRIATARQEMERISEFDYVVINRDACLEQTVEQIKAIITAEKCRTNQRRIVL